MTFTGPRHGEHSLRCAGGRATKRASILLAAVGVLCAGCGRPGAYLKSRALDFVDCFTLEAGLGIGAGVEVQATE